MVIWFIICSRFSDCIPQKFQITKYRTHLSPLTRSLTGWGDGSGLLVDDALCSCLWRKRWVINKEICQVVCRKMQSIEIVDWQMLFLEFPWYDADFLRQTWRFWGRFVKAKWLRIDIIWSVLSVSSSGWWCLNHISRFCFNFNIKTKFYCRAVRMQECEVAKSCVSCASRNVATNHLLYWFSCHSLRNLFGEEKADKQW